MGLAARMAQPTQLLPASANVLLFLLAGKQAARFCTTHKSPAPNTARALLYYVRRRLTTPHAAATAESLSSTSQSHPFPPVHSLNFPARAPTQSTVELSLSMAQ
jgi:hypothetical protein